MKGIIRFAAAAGVVAVAVGAGFAIAATRAVSPGSVQAISACVHAGNAQLRVVNDTASCGSDAVVSWNATVGSALAPPAANVSDVYTTSTTTTPITAGLRKDVAMLNVPAGTYFVSAKTGLGLEGPSETESMEGTCTLRTSNDQPDQSSVTVPSSAFEFATLPLQATVSFPAAGSIILACFTNVPGYAESARLTALAVGKLNVEQATTH